MYTKADFLKYLFFGEKSGIMLPEYTPYVQLNRRLKVLKHWISGKRNGVNVFELISFLLRDFYDKEALMSTSSEKCD